VKDTAQAKQEGLSQLEFRFPTGRFCKHDPKGLVLQHASQVSSCWSYAHDKFEDEIFTESAQDWDEVVQRMANPNMTRFKAMSMDEQVETIEKSAQEALRAREEIRVVEKQQKAQRRGLLLIQGAQRIIDQLQNDLDLIEMMRFLLMTQSKSEENQVAQSRYRLKKPPGQKTLKLHHHRSDHQGKFRLSPR
jgi:hypothetical protein